MSVDTKRFKLHHTDIEYDTYYPSEFIFNTITNPLALSAFKAAEKIGFNIDKLVIINKIKLECDVDEVSASASLKHIIDFKLIDCIVLIDINAICDESGENIICNDIDKCEFLEINGFRNFDTIYHDSDSKFITIPSIYSHSYMLVNHKSRQLLKEVISRELE